VQSYLLARMVFLPVVRSYSLGLDFLYAAIMSVFAKEIEFGKKR